MKDYQYLIIGGGIAAGRACEGIRQVDEHGSIALITDEAHRPYERPPLSKGFLRGETGVKRVFLQEADFYTEKEVEIIQSVAVTRIDPKQRNIELEDGRSLGYQKLLLATGGRARQLPLPGIDLKSVFTLRSIEDSESIRAAGGEGKKALVMGGSFIGAEVAASLTQMGTEVDMIFPESRLLERIVPVEVSEHLAALYQAHHVHIHAGTVAKKIEPSGQMIKAYLDNGEDVQANLVILGVGIQLNTELAHAAGLELREHDQAVLVDENLRTSDPHIYAAGDIAAWPDPTFNTRLRVEHWDVARRQGIHAGRSMAGEHAAYTALPYFFSDLFDLSFEVWGNLDQWEQTVTRGAIQSGSFAVYYFDDQKLTGVLAVDRPDSERLPMQNLVKARLAYQELVKELQDEEVDLATLAGKGSESEPTPAEGAPRFAADIRPLFREMDIEEMKEISGFDLSAYEDVRAWAKGIYARLVDGSMPCDEPWSEEHTTRFKRWMDTGFKP